MKLNKKLDNVDLSNAKLLKRLKNRILDELTPKNEVKNIVLVKQSSKSMNCIPYYNYNSESTFIDDDSKESYALTDSIFELEGVPVYMVHKDTHVNYVMEMTDLSEIADKKRDKYIIKQKLMTASQIFSIHESSHIKNWFSKPKLDFNLSVSVLLLIAICCIITYMITYSIYYNPK